MNLITLYPPEVRTNEVAFHWHIQPPSMLYRSSQFTLRFPDSFDLTCLPESLWWTVGLTCLHSQWPLLRPCCVRLPVTLRSGEAECWGRLMDAEVATLEAYGGTSSFAREVEILEDGPSLSPPSPLAEEGRCVTAFSGGKDSLLQTGLLTELSRKPVLVTTTSPMPPLEDHLTPRRRYVLNEIKRRREVMLVEVDSDYRANFNHGFAMSRGYPISVNEVTDTFLYTGAMLITGAALGAGHLFLASEAEVQENVELDGRVIQHKHFMYSAVTQRVLDALLQPYGIRYGSLIAALHSFQVQTLLWTRYADLSDLQYSCWRVKRGESMCNRCDQCMRVALRGLALGGRPSRIGVDWITLFNEMWDWKPKMLDGKVGPVLPKAISAANLHAQVVRDFESLPVRTMFLTMARDALWGLLMRRGWNALSAYRNLRQRAIATKVGPPPGYRARFLGLVDPLLHDQIAAILAAHFSPAEESSYAEVFARFEALVKWITEPLNGVSK